MSSALPSSEKERGSSGPEVAGYRLLIFDWDGTLIDSIGTIVGCTQATLAELGLPAVEDSRIRRVIGLGLRETVETICPGCGEDTFRSIVEVYRRLWLAGWGNRPTLFDGVDPLLAGLSEQRRVLAVATAKNREGLDRDLARTGVGEHFATSRTVTESPSKPDPGMVFEIQRETGVDPAATLMIGDSLHDLQMAANAGVDAVGVATGTERAESLLTTPALACLPSVLDLPRWLEARFR